MHSRDIKKMEVVKKNNRSDWPMKKILFVYGTRPEAIKMAPLILEMKNDPKHFDVKVCLTGQHREMLDQVNSFFGLQSDYDLNLMQPNQTLFDITARCLKGLEPIISGYKPDLIFVQGDTTTVMATSLAAYYKQIPLAHLEAGLRSGNRYSPFPEEVNRIIAGHIAEWHFAPTIGSEANLNREGLEKNIHVVGNTVIDALLIGLRIIQQDNAKYSAPFSFLDPTKRLVLVTGHRRESFGAPFENMCLAMKEIVSSNPDVEIVYPVHLNPNVQEPVKRILGNLENVKLIPPLDYPYLLWIMNKSYIVLTDSGGIQEEAPAMGKPVLVMRDVTERQEGIDSGTAKLVGTDKDRIVSAVNLLLRDKSEYEKMAKAVNPYGDGTTSRKIAEILK